MHFMPADFRTNPGYIIWTKVKKEASVRILEWDMLKWEVTKEEKYLAKRLR